MRKVKFYTKKNFRQTGDLSLNFCLKILAVVVLISLSTFSLAVLYNGGEPTAKASITTALQAVVKAISSQYQRVRMAFDTQMSAMDATVAKTIQTQTQSVQSAVRVWTKQKSVGANELAVLETSIAQKKAAALQAQYQADRMIQTMENKGAYGQGHKVCQVLSEREQTAAILEKQTQVAPALIANTIYNSPGTYRDPYSVYVQMNAKHSSEYCTQEQSAAGYCTATDKAGWDLMMSTLFTPTIAGSDVYKAQNTLINNMVGLPDRPVPKELVGAPGASNYILMKQRKDAIISPALYSLKSIQAEYLGVDGTENSAKIPPITAINKQVKRYLGEGQEYKEWNKTLTTASERGVMKELLQVQALDLALLARQYKANEREELLLAGTVAAMQQLVDKKRGARTSTDADRAKISADKILHDFTQKQIYSQ